MVWTTSCFQLGPASFVTTVYDGASDKTFPIQPHGAHVLLQDPIPVWITDKFIPWLEHCQAELVAHEKLHFYQVLVGLAAVALETFGQTWPLHCAILPTGGNLKEYIFLDSRSSGSLQHLVLAMPVCTSEHWALLCIKDRRPFLLNSSPMTDAMRTATSKALQHTQDTFGLEGFEETIEVVSADVQANEWECGWRVCRHFAQALATFHSCGKVSPENLRLSPGWDAQVKEQHLCFKAHLAATSGR